MKIRTWRNIIKEGNKNLYRNRVMSLASVSAIAAALFVLGLVLIAVLNLNNIMDGLESQIEISIYMQDESDYSDIAALEYQLRDYQGVYEVEFVSKEQALENWREEWGDKRYLLDGYGPENNPLPDAIHIKVEKPEYVESIVELVNSSPYVESLQYSRDVVDSIASIVFTTRLIGLAVVIILIIMAMIIINNTIKITVYSRRKEINIMKYIGATDWYIRWPFIVEGLVIGLLGALAAGGFTMGVYKLLLDRTGGIDRQENILSMFRILPFDEIVFYIAGTFFVVGSLVGLAASLISVRKHLNV